MAYTRQLAAPVRQPSHLANSKQVRHARPDSIQWHNSAYLQRSPKRTSLLRHELLLGASGPDIVQPVSHLSERLSFGPKRLAVPQNPKSVFNTVCILYFDDLFNPFILSTPSIELPFPRQTFPVDSAWLSRVPQGSSLPLPVRPVDCRESPKLRSLQSECLLEITVSFFQENKCIL